MKTLQKFLNYAREHEIAQVDLKFTDLFGRLHHVTVPLSRVDEGFLTQGGGFRRFQHSRIRVG